jgi:hypothetical protein
MTIRFVLVTMILAVVACNSEKKAESGNDVFHKILSLSQKLPYKTKSKVGGPAKRSVWCMERL